MDGEVADRYHMRKAIAEAERAAREGERPFGCVIVNGSSEYVGYGRGTGTHLDPTRHPEMVAIREACVGTHSGDLSGCTLYSTHEPCVMCCGAILHAGLRRVVWGSSRSTLPMLFRVKELGGARALLLDTTHPLEFTAGVLEAECTKLFDIEVAQYVERAR